MNTNQIAAQVRQVKNGVAVIDVRGEVTGVAEAILTEAYNQACSTSIQTLMLNFNGLEYMNSSGIGLLVTLLIRTNRQKQRLVAFGLTEHYQQIFELTRLNEAISIYQSEAEALTAIGV